MQYNSKGWESKRKMQGTETTGGDSYMVSILTPGKQQKMKKQYKDARDRNNRRRLIRDANLHSKDTTKGEAATSHLHRSSLGRLSSATWRSRSQYIPGRPFPPRCPPFLPRRVELLTHVVVLPSAPHQCTPENTRWASTPPRCSVCATSL